VEIESDGDLQAALTSFVEVAESGLPVQFRTIHVSECMKVLLQRCDRWEPLEPQPLPSNMTKKRPSDGSPSRDRPVKRAKQVHISIHFPLLICSYTSVGAT